MSSNGFRQTVPQATKIETEIEQKTSAKNNERSGKQMHNIILLLKRNKTFSPRIIKMYKKSRFLT